MQPSCNSVSCNGAYSPSCRIGTARHAGAFATAVSAGSEMGGVRQGSWCTWPNSMALEMCMLI